MKLDTDVNIAELSNVSKVSEFKIKATAHSFKILSSGLYSNKIRAIIRELSTNALDAQTASCQDTPFEVHLPTTLEPWFSVRDFGVGLDSDEVTNIYTVYFESTKTHSNAYIGALGLGAKSPFSYTENFTVTAIKSGTKRIYSVFINEHGVPSIAEMHAELTDECSGVEVKFSVVNKYDYDTFRFEAQDVFKWFTIQPVITGLKVDIPALNYKEKNIVPGVHSMHNSNQSVAVMGNIAYPLSVPEPEKHFGNLSNLLKCGLIINFDIGDLDFAASREHLSYIPSTIANIKNKLELLNLNLVTNFAAKANAIQNEWDRAAFIYSEHRSYMYKAAVVKYTTDTKFPLYNSDDYNGQKTFEFTSSDLAKLGIKLSGFSRLNGHIKSHKIHNRVTNTYEDGYWITVDPKHNFVLNDLTVGCLARAKYHFKNTNDYGSVFCVSYDPPAGVVASNTTVFTKLRDEAYKKFINLIHNPPRVLNASTLLKKEVVKKVVTDNTGIVRYKNNNTYRGNYQWCWSGVTETFNATDIYYYVPLHNKTAIDKDGTDLNISSIATDMSKCGIASIKDIVIYGVRKSRMKDIKALPNWVLLTDKLNKELSTITDAHITRIITGRELSKYNYTIYTNASVGNSLPSTSIYAKFIKDFCAPLNNNSTNTDIDSIATLCSRFGKAISIEKCKKQIYDAHKFVQNKYPLLQYLSSTVSDNKLRDYIKMVDDLG